MSISGGASFADKNVATGKTVTLSGINLNGTDAANYSIATTALDTADITPAALIITANNDSKTIDGLAYFGGNGVVYRGFVNGEDSRILGGTLSYDGTAQGATEIGDYSLSYIDGLLRILPYTNPQNEISTNQYATILQSKYAVNGTHESPSVDKSEIKTYEASSGKGAVSILKQNILGKLITDNTGYRQ